MRQNHAGGTAVGPIMWKPSNEPWKWWTVFLFREWPQNGVRTQFEFDFFNTRLDTGCWILDKDENDLLFSLFAVILARGGNPRRFSDEGRCSVFIEVRMASNLARMGTGTGCIGFDQKTS